MGRPEVSAAVDYEKLMVGTYCSCPCCRAASSEVDFLQTDPPAAGPVVDHDRLDALESAMLDSGLPLVDQPLLHLWLPGLYVRTVTNPAGSLVTTKIHKTRHPFFVLRGRAIVRGPAGTQEIVAPYMGVTEPGTRRVIFAGYLGPGGEPVAEEDVVWVTVHALTPEEEAEPDEQRRIARIEERIIERRELVNGQTSHELFLAGYAAQGKLA